MNHFEGKDAEAHVKEKKADSISTSAEAHGTEIPGHIQAAADALREGTLFLTLFWLLFFVRGMELGQMFFLMSAFAIGLIIWKTGRAAWLGYFRLERLHRVIEQEKYEIEHHRPQEREELIALYRPKGFEGKLLDDVIDVLMKDEDRLLTVMLEEELGLKLEAYEHPLKQAVGAFLGSFLAALILIGFFWIHPLFGTLIAAFLLLTLGASVAAYYEKNKFLNAVVWNIGLAVLSLGIVYFLIK